MGLMHTPRNLGSPTLSMPTLFAIFVALHYHTTQLGDTAVNAAEPPPSQPQKKVCIFTSLLKLI